jgi:uncharacterized protein (TIGR00730 family)
MDHISFFCSSRTSAITLFGEIILPLLTLLYQEGDTRTIYYGGGDKGLMGLVYSHGSSLGMNVVGHNLQKWASKERTNEIYHETLSERQNALIESGNYYIILPGGIGTIYELTQVLCHNDVEDRGKKVILYNYNHYYDGFLQLLFHSATEGLTDMDRLHLYIVDTLDDMKQVVRNIR